MNNLGSMAAVSTSLYLAWDTVEKLYGSEYTKNILAEVRKLFIVQEIVGRWLNNDVFITKKTREEAVAFFKQLSTYTIRGVPLPIRAMIVGERMYLTPALAIFTEQYSAQPCLFAVSTGAGSFHAWIGEKVSLLRLWPENLDAFVVKSQVDRDAAEVIMAHENSNRVKEMLIQRSNTADAFRRMGYTRVTTLMPLDGAQEIIPGYYGVTPSKLDIEAVINRAIERFSAANVAPTVEAPQQHSYAIFEKLADGN